MLASAVAYIASLLSSSQRIKKTKRGSSDEKGKEVQLVSVNRRKRDPEEISDVENRCETDREKRLKRGQRSGERKRWKDMEERNFTIYSKVWLNIQNTNAHWLIMP